MKKRRKVVNILYPRKPSVVHVTEQTYGVDNDLQMARGLQLDSLWLNPWI